MPYRVQSCVGLLKDAELSSWERNLAVPEDEVKTRRGTDTLVASSGKSCRFQIQLDRWPDNP